MSAGKEGPDADALPGNDSSVQRSDRRLARLIPDENEGFPGRKIRGRGGEESMWLAKETLRAGRELSPPNSVFSC